MRWRQSHLTTLDKCPLALQYSIEPPRPDVKMSSWPRELGTAYHASQEILYNSAPVLLTAGELIDHAIVTLRDNVAQVDQVLESPNIESQEHAEEILGLMLNAYMDEKHYWPVFEGTDMTFEVLGTELVFNHDAPELTGPYTGETAVYGGAPDLVLKDVAAGYILGVDHKSAGKAWDKNKHKARKQNQSPSYVSALRRIFPDAPGYRFVFDIMTYNGKFQRRVTDPTPAHEEAVRRKYIQVAAIYDWHKVSGIDLPANPSNNLCSPVYCDHFAYCPYGATLDD